MALFIFKLDAIWTVWSTLRFGRFATDNRNFGSNLRGGWVSSTANLGVLDERKLYRPCRVLDFEQSSPWSSHYTD